MHSLFSCGLHFEIYISDLISFIWFVLSVLCCRDQSDSCHCIPLFCPMSVLGESNLIISVCVSLSLLVSFCVCVSVSLSLFLCVCLCPVFRSLFVSLFHSFCLLCSVCTSPLSFSSNNRNMLYSRSNNHYSPWRRALLLQDELWRLVLLLFFECTLRSTWLHVN